VQIPPILPSPPFFPPPRQLPPGAHEIQIGSLTGVVLDASGKPAAGVVVSFRPAYNQNLLQPFDTNTDQNGRYVVPIRGWDIIASGEMNYTDIMLARDPERNLAAIHSFSWSRTTSNLDLTLQPGITLAGSIKDSQGAPVTNATVELSADSNKRGVRLETRVYKGGGAFAFSAVPQGLSNYRVDATADGCGFVGAHVGAGDIKTNRYEFAPLVLPPGNR
jgi:hypothetical protein